MYSSPTNEVPAGTHRVVPAGQSSTSFSITGIGRVGMSTTVTIVATYNGTTQTTTLTVGAASGGGGGGGGGGSNYLYQVIDVPANVNVTGLACTDIYMPTTLRISWGSTYQHATYEIQRNGVSLGTTSNPYWVDAFSFTSGTHYQYSVRINSGYQDLGLPSPPMGADPTTIAHLSYQSTTGSWTTIPVTPVQSVATDNQAADGRYDLRYSTYVFLNHNFGATVYRGGLFVGFQNDNSQVSRSFVKFQLPTLTSSQFLWACSANAYCTRMYNSGSTIVGCQKVSDSWASGTLTWSNMPSLTPSAARYTTTVTYDNNNPASSWAHWPMLQNITDALTGTGLLSLGLASTSETSANWAYFAKTQYGGSSAPCVLYAYGNALNLFDFTVSPSTVTGGTSVTGTVVFNGGAPTGGGEIVLSSSDASVATCPACVIVPQGTASVTFTIPTSAVASTQTITLTASFNGAGRSVTLTVNH